MYNLSENSEDTEMYRFIQFREVIFSLFEVFFEDACFQQKWHGTLVTNSTGSQGVKQKCNLP